MIIDGKRSINRDLVQFLDSIEEVALRKHLLYVREARNARFGKKFQTSRNAGDDERRKLLHNLSDRVEKLSKLCKIYANDEEGSVDVGEWSK